MQANSKTEKLPLQRELHHHSCVSNLIAIAGRPNVGKSALFNRIVIVHEQPGVSQDAEGSGPFHVAICW